MKRAHDYRLRRLETAGSHREHTSLTDEEIVARATLLFRQAEVYGHTPESARMAEIFERARERRDRAERQHEASSKPAEAS